MLLDTSEQGVIKNLWLLSPSIHAAFRNDHIKIQPGTSKDLWNDEDELERPDATQAVCAGPGSHCKKKKKKKVLTRVPLLLYRM